MRVLGLFLAVVLSMAMRAAGEPSTIATPSPPLTVQQQFDAASVAAAEGRCGDAVPAFDALAARPGLARNVRVMATMRIRRAPCLVALGRFEEASGDIANAMSILSADDPDSRVDIAQAHIALGKIAYLSFDYDNATREFEAGRSLLNGPEQYEAIVWLIRSTMFTEDQRSIGLADELIKLDESVPDATKTGQAGAHTLHAQALLNHGQYAAAYAELKKALAAQGGLTRKVHLSDLVTRSDLALAALLNGDRDKAREYMAYTGAGRFEKAPFSTAVSMGPPPCGGPAGLKPDDMVVVEFSISDAGEVVNVAPIFATRNGPVAAEFARAVAGWSWKPEDAKSIPAFFRRVTRVELRCSNATAHPDVEDLMRAELDRWLVDQHVEPYMVDLNSTASVELAKNELIKRQGVPGSLSVVPVLVALAKSRLIDPRDRLQWFKQARDILAAAGAPLAGLTYIDMHLSSGFRAGRDNYDQRRLYLRSLLSKPEVAADAHVASILRLLIAEPHYGSPGPPDAADLLTAVSTDPALAEQDPIKIGALVRLASLQAATGNLPAARESYRKTGLSAQECTLVDATPSMRKTGAGPEDYPMEAMRWGFEGWVMVELDILADGKTTNQRAVVAYPPLIFADAATGVMKGSRFEQSYRPEGGLGCGGKDIKVNFQLNRR